MGAPKLSTDGYYHSWVKDVTKRSGRRQVKAKTLEELEQKTNGRATGDLTFEHVYRMSQEDQIRYVKDPDRRPSVQNTIRRHNSDYKRYFAGTKFERKKIDTITDQDVKDHCFYVLSNNDLRRRAFNNFLAILRATFIFALDERYIDVNPLNTINFSSPRFTNMFVMDSNIEDRIYSDMELYRMKLYLHSKQHEFPDRISFYALEYQLLMGERRGEVAPSKWADIKEEKGIRYIEIRREVLERGHGRIVEHTKTCMNRRVPVFDEVDEFLVRLKAFHDENSISSEFLFPSKRSKSGCIDLTTTYKVFHEMCREIDISLSSDLPKGTHAYRRNFAKRVGNAELASKLLGNNEKVLRKNYYDGVDLGQALHTLNRW